MPILSGVKTIVVRFKQTLLVILGSFFLFPLDGQAETLSIFISMSMPATSLKQWSEQACQLKAPLLLRGLVNDSMKATIQALVPLTTSMPAIQIDPVSFDNFGINKVPAVVLSDGDTFDVVYGDQSLRSALWQIEMKGQLSDEAKRLREQLEAAQ